jgi:hypothetical protein
VILSNRSFRAPLAALAIAAFLAMAGAAFSAPAHAATCGTAVAYPGDSASTEAYANWMANGVSLKKLPGELPVMAGLVESGLKNLSYGDADSVGFFQMRASIWNKGPYAGYLKKPDLQLQWFIDQATAVQMARPTPPPVKRHTASGSPTSSAQPRSTAAATNFGCATRRSSSQPPAPTFKA